MGTFLRHGVVMDMDMKCELIGLMATDVDERQKRR